MVATLFWVAATEGEVSQMKTKTKKKVETIEENRILEFACKTAVVERLKRLRALGGEPDSMGLSKYTWKMLAIHKNWR